MTDNVELRKTYPAPQSPTGVTSFEVEQQEPLLDGAEPSAGEALPGAGLSTRVVKEERAGDMIFNLLTLLGLLTFLLATWYLAISTAMGLPTRQWFLYHPTNQSLGLAFMVMGIQTLQPTATSQSKKAGLTRHQVLQIACFLSISFGTLAIVLNKISHSARHLISWHAYFGLVCYLWLIAQSAFGAASVWFKGRAFGGELKAKRMWKYHRMSGYALLGWMMGTSLLAGGWSGWATTNSGVGFRVIGYGISLVLVGVGVGGRVRVGKMKFW